MGNSLHHRIVLLDRLERPIGFIEQSWMFLPDCIKVMGSYYQRVGKMGDCKYKRINKSFEVNESNTRKIVIHAP